MRWYLKSIKATLDDRHLNKHAPNIALTYACNKSCSYCYAEGLQQDFPREMRLEDLRAVILWLERQGVEEVIFTGGEPTQHSRIQEILALIRQARFRASFYSNGLIAPQVLDRLTVDNTSFLNLHYNYKVGEEQYYRYLRTLETLKQRGVRFSLRVNIDNPDIEPRKAIYLAKRYDCKVVFCMTNPGYTFDKPISHEELMQIGKLSLDFMATARAEGVVSIFARPFPLCMFPERLHRRLHLFHSLHEVCSPGVLGSYATRIVINPDLSTFPCYAIFQRGPKITEFKDLQEVSAHNRELYLRLRWNPLFEQCKECKFFLAKRCQGGCLAFKQKA